MAELGRSSQVKPPGQSPLGISKYVLTRGTRGDDENRISEQRTQPWKTQDINQVQVRPNPFSHHHPNSQPTQQHNNHHHSSNTPTTSNNVHLHSPHHRPLGCRLRFGSSPGWRQLAFLRVSISPPILTTLLTFREPLRQLWKLSSCSPCSPCSPELYALLGVRFVQA